MPGLEAGITLIPPQNDVIPVSYRVSFECTNNIPEYESQG